MQDDFNGVKQEYKNAITSASGGSKPVEDDGIIHPPKALNPITVLLNGKEVTGYPVKFDYTDNKDKWKAQNDFLKKIGLGFLTVALAFGMVFGCAKRQVMDDEEESQAEEPQQEYIQAMQMPGAEPTPKPPLPTPVPTPQANSYIVRLGDNLWGISGFPSVMGDN